MHVRCPKCESQIELASDAAADDIACLECGSRFSLYSGLDDTLSVATQLPGLQHFQILECVGVGRFGRVFKATDVELNRIVAIKVPRQSRLSISEAEFVCREARNAAQINHPNVVRVYEVGRADDTVYIVSEFVDGLPLDRWQSTNQCDFAGTARICGTIARALHQAHQQGVIHRDLKPNNIMIDADGTPFITDFGLAKHVGSELTIAAPGAIVGTPAYMSPEQASGNANQADPRSDIFSLGVILYEMLTGRRPFCGDREIVIDQVRHTVPPRPRNVRRSVPPELETVCLKALEKKPADRYQTAADLADDLDRFLRNELITARPSSRMQRAVRWLRQNPAVAAALVLAAAVLLLLPLALRPNNRRPATSTHPPNARLVQIETVPSGAEVTFIPLGSQHGNPLSDRAVSLVEGRNSLWLIPGDYLAVAHQGQRLYHEVYRRVPEGADALPGIFEHNSWETVNDMIVLPPISLHDITAVPLSQMVRVKGGDYTVTAEDSRTSYRIPAFFVDSGEITFGDYRRVMKRHPAGTKGSPRPDDHPVVNVTWDEAVAYAEAAGKRLLDELEYEYLATAGGARTFPWGDQEIAADNWEQGPVRTSARDVLIWPEAASTPIFGLFSNVAEWMSNRHGPGHCVIRGGPPQLGSLEVSGPHKRLAGVRPRGQGNLGFRCARSTRPRLLRQDFVHAP